MIVVHRQRYTMTFFIIAAGIADAVTVATITVFVTFDDLILNNRYGVCLSIINVIHIVANMKTKQKIHNFLFYFPFFVIIILFTVTKTYL